MPLRSTQNWKYPKKEKVQYVLAIISLTIYRFKKEQKDTFRSAS